MKPLFTIHGGEYLVGSHIEQHFKRLNVWIPSRDTGVDLLVSDRQNRHSVSLQVKFSKDFLVTHGAPELQKQLRACGWWTIDRQKLKRSAADLWVFVLLGFERRTTDFVVVPRRELLRRLQMIRPQKILKKADQSYLWVTESGKCWETRGLKREHQRAIANGEFRFPARDFTKWLNNWSPVKGLNK